VIAVTADGQQGPANEATLAPTEAPDSAAAQQAD
jgi:hypothetical protein